MRGHICGFRRQTHVRPSVKLLKFSAVTIGHRTSPQANVRVTTFFQCAPLFLCSHSECSKLKISELSSTMLESSLLFRQPIILSLLFTPPIICWLFDQKTWLLTMWSVVDRTPQRRFQRIQKCPCYFVPCRNNAQWMLNIFACQYMPLCSTGVHTVKKSYAGMQLETVTLSYMPLLQIGCS